MTFKEKKKTFNARPFSRPVPVNKQNIHALGRVKRFAGTQAASSSAAENKDHPVRRRQKSTARSALASDGSLFTLHSSRLSGPLSLSAGNGLKWNKKGALRSLAAAHLLRLDSGAEIGIREWTVPEKPQWGTGQETGGDWSIWFELTGRYPNLCPTLVLTGLC